MRVAALVHFSQPYRMAGSEVVLHELMKAAATKGHDAYVWCTHRDSERVWRGQYAPERFDGVKVHRVGNPLMAAKAVAWWRPDVLVTHHQHATLALKVAQKTGARSVYLTHNQMDINARPLRAKPDLVIHNTEWVRESLQRFGKQKLEFVFHPPLTPERHRVRSTGDAYTLINMNRDKGADLFYQLAEQLPDRKFLGVEGGHGPQLLRRKLSNVDILRHGPNMKPVWSSTRVLLMPSVYESYGLTAVEAGINAIPTIANPTPGLVENIGPGGLFADRDNPQEWVNHIEALDNPTVFEQASGYASQLADTAMDATRQNLDTWCQWLTG